jgi:hypothetical protein
MFVCPQEPVDPLAERQADRNLALLPAFPHDGHRQAVEIDFIPADRERLVDADSGVEDDGDEGLQPEPNNRRASSRATGGSGLATESG